MQADRRNCSRFGGRKRASSESRGGVDRPASWQIWRVRRPTSSSRSGIALGPALTTGPQNAQNARWRGRRRMRQKGSACGAGLLAPRASFLVNCPGTPILASRGSPPQKRARGERRQRCRAVFCVLLRRREATFSSVLRSLLVKPALTRCQNRAIGPAGVLTRSSARHRPVRRATTPPPSRRCSRGACSRSATRCRAPCRSPCWTSGSRRAARCPTRAA